MPKRIAEVLEILNDRQWHPVDEIQQKLKLNEDQIRQITKFLSDYKFITLDSTKYKIRIRKEVQKFLSQPAIS